MAEWYYSAGDGVQRGPVDSSALKRLAASGRLSPTDLIWRDGMTEWASASKVNGLFPSDSLKPPPMGMAEDFEAFPHPGPIARRDFAGFWLRAVANFIDSLILGFGCFVAMYGTAFMMVSVVGVPDHQGAILYFIGMYVVAVLMIWLYYALMESSRNQATVGKLLLGLKVTDLEGYPIGFGRATGRLVGKSLSGLFWGVGFLMAGLTERKQALHDMIAGTLVVRA